MDKLVKVFSLKNLTLIWNLFKFHLKRPSTCSHWITKLQIFSLDIMEFSTTYWSICGDIDLTTKETIIQMHHFAYNQFSSSTFDEMRQYTFQKALNKNIVPVYWSVKQLCFHITKDTCANCSRLPFIDCAWCWKYMCF